MCDPVGAAQRIFEDVGDTAESVVRGANDAIDSGIRGVGGSIEEAAPYIIAATAAYFGIPPELVTASELETAYAAGTITAEQYATANAAIGMAGETASGVYASASEIAAAQAGAAGVASTGIGETGATLSRSLGGPLGGPVDMQSMFTPTTFDPNAPGVMNITGQYGAGATAGAGTVAGNTGWVSGYDLPSQDPGVFDNFLNYISGITPSSAASGLNTASNLLKAGSSLTGAVSGINSIRNPGMSPTQAQNTADPFASSRQQYINQLNAVMANPSLTMSQPGYQFQYQQGLQGLNRKLAKSGMSTDTPGQPGVPASGAAGIAQQVYGQQYALGSYNDYVKQLSGLAGAGQLPGVGGQAALTAQTAAQKQAQTGWEAATKGVGALSTLFSNSQTRKPPPNTTPADIEDNIYWNTPQSVPDTVASPSGYYPADTEDAFFSFLN